MSKTRIAVPDGMLEAAMSSIQPSVLVGTQSIALEAALLWQSESLSPPDALLNEIVRGGIPRARGLLLGWIRHMYDAPEASAEEFVECDACRVKPGSPTLCRGCLSNRALIEKLTGKETRGRSSGVFQVPLQCGERLMVRGDEWEVQTIDSGGRAVMKRIVKP
jgi:hypothetical protein